MGTITSSLSGDIGLTAATPTIENQSIALAATEYNYVLPANTKRFKIQNRLGGPIQISFIVTQSATKFWTVFPGQQFDGENIKNPGGLTIYYQSPNAGQMLEIISWS